MINTTLRKERLVCKSCKRVYEIRTETDVLNYFDSMRLHDREVINAVSHIAVCTFAKCGDNNGR